MTAHYRGAHAAAAARSGFTRYRGVGGLAGGTWRWRGAEGRRCRAWPRSCYDASHQPPSHGDCPREPRTGGGARRVRVHGAAGALPRRRCCCMPACSSNASTAEFAGITHGQKTTDFLARLVERQYATPIATGALHRGRLFHVHYKPLWAAIGEPDSRFRKPATLGRLIERVMLLDAVLADRDLVWLGPSADKLRFFASEGNEAGRLRPDEYPHICFGDGPDEGRPGTSPTSCRSAPSPYGSPHVFLYLVTKPSPGRLPRVPDPSHEPARCPPRVDRPPALSAAPHQGDPRVPRRRPGPPGDRRSRRRRWRSCGGSSTSGDDWRRRRRPARTVGSWMP